MQNHQIKLIDSTYDVQQAKEMLLALINSKLSFIDHQIFACGDCYGADTTHMKVRKNALVAEKARLVQVLKSYQNGNNEVELDCTISLNIRALSPA